MKCNNTSSCNTNCARDNIVRPLSGTWRCNNGVLCCGTLRVAREDFDTNPHNLFKQEVWDWIVDALNRAVAGEAACSPRRPPCALMTASAAVHADCAALKKLADAGYEIVVVQDADFEASTRILEKVRRETLAAFNNTANSVAEKGEGK